jgi:SOS-response transcriptional repressors (recA-mediated autopeptidases)|nr:MAG TPA: Repressor protein CI [Caudoviricetes sp.]
MTLEDLGNKIGVSRQTIQRYESGVITNIPSDKIELLAKYLSTTPSYLMGWENSDSTLIETYENIYPIELKRFPLLGEIACGEPRFASEDRESYVEASTDIQADFCLKAKGDSMINARIQDGDIVFIREQPSVYNGEIAAVVIDDEATLKRVFYYPEKDLFILKAENPKYDDLVYSKSELDNIRILGKAIAFQSDVI